MTIEEILKLESDSDKVAQLMKRSTKLPSYEALIADWDPSNHDVMNPTMRKDGVKVIEPEERDQATGRVTKNAVTEPDPTNRISLPIEQDIVNIHTAFTVGTEPKVSCSTEDAGEKELFSIIQNICKKNKIKYLNKKAVRSWLSETEVAEYWYTEEDSSWWGKIVSFARKQIGIKTNVSRKLKVAVWSPFRGDKLYPLFDEFGKMIAFSRGYKVKVDDLTEIECFMTITDKYVYKWRNNSGWVSNGAPVKHNFGKLPVMYMQREKPLCESIRPIRDRLETLLSNYADCVDYNFFPKLVLEGDVVGTPTKGNGDMIKLAPRFDGAKSQVYYLTWTQTPESIKLEMDSLFEKAYSFTNTPRISFENLKGMGQAQSGTAFKFTFMGAHMAVENHAETVGEYLQRRYNFLVAAIGSMDSSYYKAAQTLDIDVEITPYMIDDLKDKIDMAINATGGKAIASRKEGIILAGITDQVEDELKAIEDEEAKLAEQNSLPTGGL